MPRARKHSPTAAPRESGREQIERLIEAVQEATALGQEIAGQLKAVLDGLDDMRTEVEWHIRNFKDHIQCLADVLERHPRPAELPSPDTDADEPAEGLRRALMDVERKMQDGDEPVGEKVSDPAPAEDLAQPQQEQSPPAALPAGSPQQRTLWQS